MWRLPGNTCFEKPNIYPCIRKNTRLIAKFDPTPLPVPFGPPGKVGRRGGLLHARRPVRLLYIPNRFYQPVRLFLIPLATSSVRDIEPQHSWDSLCTKDQIRADLQGTYCQHYPLPWVLWMVACYQVWSPGSGLSLIFGPWAVVFLDITSLTFF